MRPYDRARRAGIVPLTVGVLAAVVLSVAVASPASAASSNLRFLAWDRFINQNSQSQSTLQCLATPNHSTANGTKEIQWPCSSSSDQVWTVYNDDSFLQQSPPREVWELRNLSSDKCLADPNKSPTRGVQMIQWTCNNGDEQRWELVSTSSNGFELKNVSSHLCLAVTGGSHADGAAIIQWDCHGGLEQLWITSFVGG